MRIRPIPLILLGLVIILLALTGFYARFMAGTNAHDSAARGTVTALAVDPADGSLLEARGGLFRSTDHGQSWQAFAVPADFHPSLLHQVAMTTAAPTRIYAAGSGAGIIRSDDAGKTWHSISAKLPSQQIAAFAVHSFRPDTLFAWIAGQGSFRTQDGGTTWEKMDAGPPAPVVALAHSTLPGSMNTGWLYAATAQGPYLSMDCFCGWRQVSKLPGDAKAKLVLVDPKQPMRTYAVAERGLFRSDDAGQTWHAADQGLPMNGIAVLAIDPRQPQRLYAATASGTLYLSEDGATTWRPLTAASSHASTTP